MYLSLAFGHEIHQCDDTDHLKGNVLLKKLSAAIHPAEATKKRRRRKKKVPACDENNNNNDNDRVDSTVVYQHVVVNDIEKND